MALVLALTSAFASEQPAQETARVKLLVMQGEAGGSQPSELAAALAMIPALGVDYAAFYDDGHLSICSLTLAETYADRAAVMDSWIADYTKARYRNASHHTMWSEIANLPANEGIDLSSLDVLWLPAGDMLEEHWQNLQRDISLLTACGGTLRLFATEAAPQLKQKLASFPNVQITSVTNPVHEVPDILLTEAGYYHVADDAAKEMVRRVELQPSHALPGDSVLIDRCDSLHLVGLTYTYGGTSVGFTTESDRRMAITSQNSAETAVGEQATLPGTEDSTTDAEVPENVSAAADASMVQMYSEVSAQSGANKSDAQLTSIVSQHQLCWYFKPDAALGVSMTASPAVHPFTEDETLTATLTLESSTEAEAAQLRDVNLLSSGSFRLSAVLCDPSGRETALTLAYGGRPGVYQTTFARPEAGSYIIRATITRTDIPFSYPSLATSFAVEAPARASAAASAAPVKLVVAPMLWHGGETEVTLDMDDYFSGYYTPVTCRTYNRELAQLKPAGDDAFTLTALKEGQTQLFLMARDGETSVVVPVEIINGQKLVLIEAGAALVVVLLALYTVLFARTHQPRFRKGEKLTISIDGGEAFSLPLKSYRASGVSLWRLLVISSSAAEHKASIRELKRIVFMPKRDRVIAKNGKGADVLITGIPKEFSCGDHTFTVTLEATDPNA